MTNLGRHGGRLHTLTSLRFIAALMVVAYHASHYVPGMQFALPVTGSGMLGVTFFFVLSGFVLAWSQRRPPGPEGHLAEAVRFWWRRFARIWPLHVVAVGFALALIALTGRAWPGEGRIAAVLLLVQAWSPDPDVHYSVNVPAWSLSAEAFFYAAFPALALLLHRRNGWRSLALLAAVVIGAVVVAGRAHVGVSHMSALYVAPYARIGEFIAGMALAGAMRAGWRSPLRVRTAALLAVLAYGAIHAASQLIEGPALRPSLSAALAVPAVLLLVASAATADLAGRTSLLTRPSSVALGEWSFALYLLHCPLLLALGTTTTGWSTAAVAAATTASVLVAIALSALAHVGVERPVEQRLRRLVAPSGKPAAGPVLTPAAATTPSTAFADRA